MDIGLKEWLIIGGLLLIGLIIFDGWRRMKGQRNTLKIDIDRGFTDSDDTDVAEGAHNPELPNGGARALQDDYHDQSYVHDGKALNTSERIDPGFDHLNDRVELKAEPQTESTYKKANPETAYQQPEGNHSNAVASNPQPEFDYNESPRQLAEQRYSQSEELPVELDPLFDDIPEILSPVRQQVAEQRDTTPTEQSKSDNEQPSPEKSEYLDLEQPITVLMRQASEKQAEDEAQQSQEEMFFYPDEQVPSSDKNNNGSEANPKLSPEFDSEYQETERAHHYEEPKVLHNNGASAPASDQQELSSSLHNANADTINEPVISSELDSESITEPTAGDSELKPEQDSLFESDHLESARSERKALEQAPEPEEVLVITVVGKQQPLDGQTLLQVVLACGMRFGDMSLFHRFEEGVDKGPVQFSMANAVNPGTFDLEHMSEMTTPGVSFFMSMSEPEDAKNAFECMLATAETVSKHLGGDLLDENRSVMRPQTKAHYRERIREFEMHKLHRRNLS
ncbi:cell division protein ZipA [Neptunomonas japonica]|uniref:cell division protein ZipA n=1 Tax=Neptunomonas japonica TaxID=417574 RepID=UPI0004246243|nr:cell division protein ZipA [Neptunomonas japonica]